MFGVPAIVIVGLFIFIASDKDKVTVTENTPSSVAKNADDTEINHHLDRAKVFLTATDFTAELNAMGLMPLHGESGAVGYGIITGKGTDEVVISTTHGGVLDSEMQKDASDPVWHNHIVRLGEVSLCGENPGVIDITFESPGDIAVKNSGLVMAKVPAEFNGTHSLTNKKIIFAPGTDIQKVVQFRLEPKFSEPNKLQAVCVTNIEEVPFDLSY